MERKNEFTAAASVFCRLTLCPVRLSAWFCMPLLFVFLVASARGGGLTKGKYAGEFLSLGAGARSLGMGGAEVAFARDVNAIYWNAAGLARLNYPELALMHAEQFAGGVVRYNFGAFAIPYGKESSLGIGLIRLAVDGIPFTQLPREDLDLGEPYVDDNGVTRINRPFIDHEFSDAEYAFFLSYARARSSRFRYGGSVKIVHKGFDQAGAWGIGFDIGTQLQLGDHLLLGANLQDATTTILAWDTGHKELIVPTLKVGAALPVSVDYLRGTLLPAVDLDFRFEGREFAAQLSGGPVSIEYHAGAEYVYRETVALRLGADAGNFTAGAGIYLPRLAIDYAFMSHSELENTHRISLRITLADQKFRRR